MFLKRREKKKTNDIKPTTATSSHINKKKNGDVDQSMYSNPNLSRLSEWLVEAEKASLSSVPFDEILQFQPTKKAKEEEKTTNKERLVVKEDDEDREDDESKNSVSTRSTNRSSRFLGKVFSSRSKEESDDVRDEEEEEEEEEVASQTSNSLVSTASSARSSFRAPSILKKSSYGTSSTNRSSLSTTTGGGGGAIPILRKKVVQFSEYDDYDDDYDYDDDHQYYSFHDNYRWIKITETVSLAKKKLGFRIVKKKGLKGIYLSDIHAESPLAGTSLKSGMRIIKINNIKVPDSIKDIVTLIRDEKYKSAELKIDALQRVKEDTFDQAMEDLGCKIYDLTEMEQDLEDGIDSVFGDTGCVRPDSYCLLEDQMERFFDSISALHGCTSSSSTTTTTTKNKNNNNSKGRRGRRQRPGGKMFK